MISCGAVFLLELATVYMTDQLAVLWILSVVL